MASARLRFGELDAIRGLAALSVLLFHMFMFWELVEQTRPGWAPLVFDWSPLRVLLTGKTTLFFFVLSGFVLAYPYFSGRAPAYVPYVIRRVVRVYVPYLASLALVIALMASVSGSGYVAPGGTFASMWTVPVTWDLLISHVLLVGEFNIYAFNSVIWSLVHEMRISLLIPLIVWLVRRHTWHVSLATGLALALAGGALHLVFQSPYPALYKTLCYVLMFIVGALLAKNMAAILAWYRGLPRRGKLTFAMVSLLLYTYASLLLTPLHRLLADWVTTLAIAGLLVTALGSARASAWLQARPLRTLGQLPYGVYLYHLPIMFVLMHLLHDRLPLLAIMGLTLVLTLLAAHGSRQVIELPAGRWAQGLAARYSDGPGEGAPTPNT